MLELLWRSRARARDLLESEEQLAMERFFVLRVVRPTGAQREKEEKRIFLVSPKNAE